VTARGITDGHQMQGGAGCFDAQDQAVLTIAGAGWSRSVQAASTDTVVGCGWS
jgi:hypothetical protein